MEFSSKEILACLEHRLKSDKRITPILLQQERNLLTVERSLPSQNIAVKAMRDLQANELLKKCHKVYERTQYMGQALAMERYE
jgi:hypothetical protein